MASIQMDRMGGTRAFNHSAGNDAEAEYDRLRDEARRHQEKHQQLAGKARQAYQDGDGEQAHIFSQGSKKEEQQADDLNRKASDYIFRENNAPGRVAEDTIDLHGQFVQEAERILEERIQYAQSTGQTHLHVIVGRGNHSANHIQKIKPRVEQVCRELGLQYATEENAGRIYVNLQGGEVTHMPPMPQQPSGYQGGYGSQNHGGQQEQYQQQQYGGQQHQQQQYGGQQQHQQQNEQDDIVEKLVNKIVRKLGDCCVVM
ncbi:Smr domain protein [Xylariaceae sp. FL1019]|nr:Smr domain protein [Xylariaceae sp. FL1019]